MKIDTHIHSTFSYDGKSPLEEMCLSAIQKHFSVICFTEHLDLNPNDESAGFYNHDKFSDGIKRVQDKYSDKIKILKGIEFSEPHLYPKELDHINNLDFDYILGAVHWLGSCWPGDPEYIRNTPIEKIFETHYEETLRTCEYGLFDCLAHIDFPKRYLEEKIEPIGIITEILKTIINNGISLEINTSTYRKGYEEPYPSDSIIDMYKELNGNSFTIGSDAHHVDDIGADMEKIKKEPFMKFCYYEKRKKVIIS